MSGIIGHTTYAILAAKAAARHGLPVAPILQRHQASSLAGSYLGSDVQTLPAADDLLWSKLVINAAINPLTALLQVPNGELLTLPAARILMRAAAGETAAVAAALGRRLTFSDPVAAAEAVARRTATNHSSMFQDVKRGARTEIDAISGAIATAGDQYDVQTPVNRAFEILGNRREKWFLDLEYC